MEQMNIAWIGSFCFSVLRLSTPIIFASLAAAVCEKTGLFNMAVESMMLCGALAGVIFSGLTQNAFLGFLAAVVIGTLVGLLISYGYIIAKADLMLTQIAINLAAAGGTIFVLFILTGQKASSAVAIKSLAMPSISIPLIRDIPLIGKIVSGHNVLTYLAFVMAFLLDIFFKRTKLGLRMRAVGENPDAAESVGISPVKICFIAFGISGALGGIGGAFMSMGYLTSFTKNMVAGRGYIGLCASNMVSGSPIGAMLSALLFGCADAVGNSMQMTNIPTDFVLTIPYLVTVIGLVVISIRRMKKAKKVKSLQTSK